jgi:hypothetical protein
MFLEYSDFIRSLVLVRPAVGTVWWCKETDLVQTVAGLGEAVMQALNDAKLSMLHGEGHDGDGIRRELTEQIQAADADRTWLFLSKIEEVLPAVAEVLNGAREQLRMLRGMIVFVREDRRGEFQRLCPDLMDWVGLRICFAHRLSPPLGLEEVNKSLHRLESRYQVSSSSYQADPSGVRSKSPHDAWLWTELLTIQLELSTPDASEQ